MTDPDELSGSCFDDRLCFVAYTLSHAFTRRYRLALAEFGLTYPQFLAVRAVAECGSPTISELTRHLRMNPGTLTSMLKLMERDGIIARERKDSDERIVRVRLTRKGRDIARAATAAMTEVRSATGKTSDELSKLVEKLLSVRDSLDRSSDDLESEDSR